MIKKSIIHEACLAHTETSISTIQKVLEGLASSKRNETKSSVGDKYETGRAMIHMEEEKNHRQLSNLLTAKAVLKRIDPKQEHKQVQIGSLVQCDQGNYYIAIGIGKLKIEQEVFFVISPESPIGQLMMKQSKGAAIVFNNRTINILEIS